MTPCTSPRAQLSTKISSARWAVAKVASRENPASASQCCPRLFCLLVYWPRISFPLRWRTATSFTQAFAHRGTLHPNLSEKRPQPRENPPSITQDGPSQHAVELDRSSPGICIPPFSLRVCEPVYQCGIESLLFRGAVPSGACVDMPEPHAPNDHLLMGHRETAAYENATSYFPLLDRIAQGHFSKASTDKELYETFAQVLKDDGHMVHPETLSSWQFALSMRASAPRIEAHYQYYHTAVEPSLKEEQDTSCPVWVLFDGKQFCSPALDAAHGRIVGDS